MNTELLQVNHKYSNKEICEFFLCAPQGGMRRSKRTNTLILIANHTNSIYEDKWTKDTMHYTGMGSIGDQSLNFAQNKTLANSAKDDIQVHLFEVFIPKEYTYLGEVYLSGKPFIEKQLDSEKSLRNVWVFPLKRKDGLIPTVPSDLMENILQKRVNITLASSVELLEQRIANRNSEYPGERKTTSTSYQRDPDVIAYALKRAKGFCELCGNTAPFKKRDGEPFLEVHHIEHLADGGKDSIDNTVALCPNCHRKLHSIKPKKDIDKLQNLEKYVS